jgi:spore photoproduct lyase
LIRTIYVEESVREHPRVAEVRDRFPDAIVIACDRYGEVFNPSAQSFRLQKSAPALVLARKEGKLVLEAPPGFGIGGERNFYFSHMLNCLYDCRYCFLQGMFRSAHYVLFVNYEDFKHSIDETLAAAGGEPCTFFSGYDCDSLAMESITAFAAEFLPFFASRPRALLELRTKSLATRELARHSPADNVVVAFSLTPHRAATAVEHEAPAVASRIEAMRSLAEAGWKLGLRLDPLLWYHGWQADYGELVGALADAIPEASVHSISVGPLRFPRQMYQRIEAMYPEEPLLAGGLRQRGNLVSYGETRESELVTTITDMLRRAFPAAELFSCSSAAT